MNDSVESLLEDDHKSLGKLLAELDAELTTPDIARALQLLDLFWARLAVHIRAEHLQLFPALTSAAASQFTGRHGLPTSDEVQNVIARLRSDHDYFMKELASMIKTMREIRRSKSSHLKEVKDLQRRLSVMKKRLNDHNRLEEEQVYVWPGLIFDKPTVTELSQGVRTELKKRPPRFG